MRQICVIDNSTLVNLTRLRHLKIFKDLRNVFQAIYVPAEVYQEYQNNLPFDPERKWVIDQINFANLNFLSFCNKLDTITYVILKTTPGIDPGEAEAAAQHKALGSHVILSDDQSFIDAIRAIDPCIRIWGTLHLIALIDFHGIGTRTREEHLKKLFLCAPFKAKTLRDAYRDIINYLGLDVSSNALSKKVSLKALGLAT